MAVKISRASRKISSQFGDIGVQPVSRRRKSITSSDAYTRSRQVELPEIGPRVGVRA